MFTVYLWNAGVGFDELCTIKAKTAKEASDKAAKKYNFEPWRLQAVEVGSIDVMFLPVVNHNR